jgi:hypothetical protein
MNKSKYILRLLFAITIFAAPISSFSQIGDETIVIENQNKKLDLPPANRNFEKINIEAPVQEHTPQVYNPQDVNLTIPNLVTKIKVNTMSADALPKLYGNYVKAGFGNYTTPYLEGFFNSKRSDQFTYGGHFLHYSSQNGPVAKKFSSVSNNRIDLYGKYFTDKVVLKAGINYARDRYNFYGTSRQPSDRDSIKQIYNIFSLTAGFESLSKTSKFIYDYNGGFYSLHSFKGGDETEFMGTGAIRYQLSDEMYIGSSSLLSFSKRKDSSSLGRSFYQIKPYFNYILKDQFNVKAGLNFAYTNDTVGNKFHVYPSINVDYVVVKDKLTAFAGIDGEMQRNNLRTFVNQNPYLKQDVVLLHTNKAFELYAGGKGFLMGNLSYKGRIAYQNYKNLYFFNNSRSDTSRFEILYSKTSTSVVNVTGDVGYELSERLRLGVVANYYKYSVGTDSLKAWHRPSFTTSFLGTYNLQKKIYFNLDIYYISGLRGKNYQTGREVKLPDIVDLNFKVDYRFSNMFSTFIEFNNILSKNYQRYLYYPVKGFNVLVGLTYSF